MPSVYGRLYSDSLRRRGLSARCACESLVAGRSGVEDVCLCLKERPGSTGKLCPYTFMIDGGVPSFGPFFAGDFRLRGALRAAVGGDGGDILEYVELLALQTGPSNVSN